MRLALDVRFIRFRDLKEAGIVSNWPTLLSWVRNEGFPAGRLIGPHSRAWTVTEVEQWLATRPTAKQTERSAEAA